MGISCPRCRKPIDEANVNFEAGAALCSPCNALWPVDASRERVAVAPSGGPTSKIRISKQLDALEISARLLDVYPFLWLLVAFEVLFGIGWITFNIHFVKAFGAMTVMSIAFLLIGVAILGGAVLALFQRRRLLLKGDEALVKGGALFRFPTQRYALTKDTYCRWEKKTTSFLGTASADSSSPNQLPDTGLSLVIGGSAVPLALARKDADGGRIADEVNAYLDKLFRRTDAPCVPADAPGLVPTCPKCVGIVGPAAVRMHDMSIDCPQCDESFPLNLTQCKPLPDGSDQAQAEWPASPRPSATKVLIEFPDDGQMVILVPARGFRGSSLGLLVFGCFWCGFMAFFSWGWRHGGAPTGIVGLVITLGIVGFWIIGIAVLTSAVRSAFTKFFVLIEPDRIVTRSVLLGRERTKDFPRDGATKARLEVAYSSNDVPVHRVAFTDDAAKARFGTGLAEDEKKWLVAEINAFLEGRARGSTPADG